MFIKFLTNVIRVPFDIILLTFHWVKGVLFLCGQFLKDMFELPPGRNWPYGCLSVTTKTGKSVCLPGRKYGNRSIFHSLCPDVDYSDRHGCFCCEAMEESHRRWKPPMHKVLGVGLFLFLFWLSAGYCCYLGLRAFLPDAVKLEIRESLGIKSTRRVVEAGLRDAKTNTEQARVFYTNAEAFFEDGKFNDALLEYRNAIKNEPENSKGYYGLGRTLMKLNRRSEATAAFDQVIELDPTMAEAYLELSELAWESGEIELAVTYVDKVIALKPETPKAYLIKAACYRTRGDEDGARELLKTVSELPIDDPEILRTAAVLYVQLRDYNAAETLCLRALDFDPESVDTKLALAMIHNGRSQFDMALEIIDSISVDDTTASRVQSARAEVYISKGEIPRGITEYRALIKSNPAHPNFRRRLAELLLKSGSLDEGSEILLTLISDNPDDLGSHRLLAQVYLALRLYSKAIFHAQKVLRRLPKHVEMGVVLSSAHMAQEKYSEAVELLESIVSEVPDNSNIQLMLVNAYQKLGEGAKSIKLLKELSDANPTSPTPLLSLGMIYTTNGDTDLAISSFQKVLEIVPDQPIARNNLAILLIDHKGEFGRAVELVQPIHDLYPENPIASDTLGWALFHLARLEDARALISKAVKKNPRNAVYHYHLAKTYLSLNQQDDAETSLDTALKLSSDFRGADDARKLLEELRLK